MAKKRLIEKIDRTLCYYLGLEKEEICPTHVQLLGNQLTITNTSTHKRHRISQSWESFSNMAINETSGENLEKLGLATGKALAKGLVISFEEPAIKTS